MILLIQEWLSIILGCWNVLDGHETRGIFFLVLAIYIALRRALFERFKGESE